MRIAALLAGAVVTLSGCKDDTGGALPAPTEPPPADPPAPVAPRADDEGPPRPHVPPTLGAREPAGVPTAFRPDPSWYPLRVGARWSYRVRPNHPGIGAPVATTTKTTTVEEEDVIRGARAFRLRTTRPFGPASVSWDEPRGMRVVRHKAKRGEQAPRVRIDFDRMRVGETWTETYDIPSQIRTATGELVPVKRIERWTVESLDDPVLVPAGRFTCARLRLVWTTVTGGRATDGGVKTFFYARGVGKVAEASEGATEELVYFYVPGPRLAAAPVPPAPRESALGACNDSMTFVTLARESARPPVDGAGIVPVMNRFGAAGELTGSARGHVGVTVVQPSPPPALSGGTLLVLRDGKTAVAGDPDRDRVWIVDLATERPIAEVRLRAGDEPGRLVEDGDGRVHVVLRRAGEVLTLAPSCWAIEARRPVCSAPRGLAREGDRLHVACAGGELVSLPARGGGAVRTVTLDRDLRDVVVAGDGRLFVTTFRSAQVLVVGADGAVAARLAPPSVGSRSRPRPPGVAPTDDPFVPSVAWRAAPRPAGGVYLLHQRAFSGVMGTEPGRYYGSQDPCTSVVETVVTALESGGAPRVSSWLARATVPLDLAVSADGARLALVSAGNSHVGDIGAEVFVARAEAFTEPANAPGCVTPEVPLELRTTSGARPPEDAAAEFPGGLRVIRAYPVRGEPVAVAFERNGHVVVQTREPATLQLPRLGRTIWLSDRSRYDTGHAIFHGNAGRYIACASCHPEGGDDGRVWRFAFSGARRTQGLRGGVLETPPFHWDGDIRDVGHLVEDVFVKRMTGPRLASEQMTALKQWIDGLPLLATPAPRDPRAAERGRALFARHGCLGCHGRGSPAVSGNVDVGTGKPFQVPSLRGLVYRAPYMHDGCAATLADRFAPGRCGGDGRHGQTASLEASEIADLVAYLETL